MWLPLVIFWPVGSGTDETPACPGRGNRNPRPSGRGVVKDTGSHLAVCACARSRRSLHRSYTVPVAPAARCHRRSARRLDTPRGRGSSSDRPPRAGGRSWAPATGAPRRSLHTESTRCVPRPRPRGLSPSIFQGGNPGHILGVQLPGYGDLDVILGSVQLLAGAGQDAPRVQCQLLLALRTEWGVG